MLNSEALMKKTRLGVLLVFCAAFGLAGCQKAGPAVAQFDGEKLPLSELAQRLEETPLAYQQYAVTPEGRRQFLDLLLREKILLHQAGEAGIPGRDDVKHALKAFASEQERNQTRFREGLLIDTYLETLRDKINQANVDVVASIDSQNRLQLESYRSTQVHLEEGTSNVLQSLGLLRTVDGGIIGAGLTAATPLAAIGLANLEAIRLEVGEQTMDVDLSSAATVGDVLTLINTSGMNVNAYINNAGTGLRIASLDSEEEIEISDARRIFGIPFGVPIDESTTLIALGVSPGVIEIQNDDLIFQVDLTSAGTVGEVLDLINTAPNNGGIRAVLNATSSGIDIISPYQSASLEVREVGAGTTAAQLGILDIQNQNTATALGLVGEGQIDETEPMSLFQTLIDLEAQLREGGQESAIMARHTELSQELDALLSVRSRSGTRVAGMEDIRAGFLDREVFLTNLLSENEDADLAEVIVRLQTQQTSIEAAMNSGARILQTSLLQFLS